MTRRVGWECTVTALAVLFPAVLFPATSHAQSSDEQAVIRVVENLFAGMKAKDLGLIERTMTADAFLIGVGDGAMSQTARDDFASGITGEGPELIERMWSPEVRIDGQIAQLWAPYDFYIGGEFSHCGFDAFHLVHVDGEWKMAGVTYSRAQPPTCEKHPEGPPS